MCFPLSCAIPYKHPITYNLSNKPSGLLSLHLAYLERNPLFLIASSKSVSESTFDIARRMRVVSLKGEW